MKQAKQNKKALRLLAQYKYQKKLCEFIEGFGIKIVEDEWTVGFRWKGDGRCATVACIELSVEFDRMFPKYWKEAYGK